MMTNNSSKRPNYYTPSSYFHEISDAIERIRTALPHVYEDIYSDFYASIPELQDLTERCRELEEKLREEAAHIDNFITP